MNNLNENSLKIKQPFNLKIILKEHQKTSIYAMKTLENDGQIKKTLKSFPEFV